METISSARDTVHHEHRHAHAPAPGKPSFTYAHVVFLHWLAAPGFYLVLAPSHPAQKQGRIRTRYIGPVSSPVAADILKTSAVAFGIADGTFRQN